MPEPTSSVIKSTNFTSSIPTSRTELRHKSEIEIEVKQEKQQQLKKTVSNNISPISISSYPTGITNRQIPNIRSDEKSFSPQYQISKRRIVTNSIQTQTSPLLFNQPNRRQQQQQQQQFKALIDETQTKNGKIQVLLSELTDYQVRIDEFKLFFLI